jgi:hypothetical protein
VGCFGDPRLSAARLMTVGDWHDANGWGWMVMTFGMLFWVVIIALGVWAVTSITRNRDTAPQPSQLCAREILDQRLARRDRSRHLPQAR